LGPSLDLGGLGILMIRISLLELGGNHPPHSIVKENQNETEGLIPRLIENQNQIGLFKKV